MNYIVMDLEWNQPFTYKSQSSKRGGEQLMFEIIQVGAVKMDENRRLIGSFNRFIAPSCFMKLHPRIRRITGITQEDLAASDTFAEVFEQFTSWCGEDYALLTWGCDDISVFVQNLDYFKIDHQLSSVYDLQPYFASVTGDGQNRHALHKAMDYYEIQATPEHSFHSAVDDAYYTSLVFQRFEDVAGALNSVVKPRKLGHSEKERKKTETKKVRSLPSGFKSQKVLFPPCPSCGQTTKITEGYIPVDQAGTYMGLSDCPSHGLIKTEVSFEAVGRSSYVMTRKSYLAEEQNPAYAKTKHLQWAKKVADLKAKGKHYAYQTE